MVELLGSVFQLLSL